MRWNICISLMKEVTISTHSGWAFSWVFCMACYHFNIILIHFFWLLLRDSVLGFPDLVSRILRKPVIWLFLQFNWQVAMWCDAGSGCGKPRNRLQTALYMCICVFLCVWLCVSVSVCMCEYICACVYVYVYMYISVYIWIYIYIYIYIYMYILVVLVGFLSFLG